MNESEALGHTFSSWEGQWEGYGSIIPPPSDFQFDHYQLPNNIIFSLTFWSNRGDSEFDHYEALPAQALSPTAQITMVRRLSSICVCVREREQTPASLFKKQSIIRTLHC